MRRSLVDSSRRHALKRAPMDSIWIKGGKRLKGEIPISGAKNAALTLLPCALLTEEKLTLANLPRLADVDSFGHLLNQLGVSTSVAGVKKGEIGRRMTLPGGRDRLDRRALRHGAQDARVDPGAGADAGARRANRPCRCPAAARSATGRSTST